MKWVVEYPYYSEEPHGTRRTKKEFQQNEKDKLMEFLNSLLEQDLRFEVYSLPTIEDL